MKSEILNKDELKVIIKTMYIDFIGLINIFLDNDYLKFNTIYDYVLGISNLVILYCFLIYYYKASSEIKRQKAENKKLEDLKRFGLV